MVIDNNCVNSSSPDAWNIFFSNFSFSVLYFRTFFCSFQLLPSESDELLLMLTFCCRPEQIFDVFTDSQFVNSLSFIDVQKNKPCI